MLATMTVVYQHWINFMGNCCRQAGTKCSALYSFGSCQYDQGGMPYGLLDPPPPYPVTMNCALERSLQFYHQRAEFWQYKMLPFISLDNQIPSMINIKLGISWYKTSDSLWIVSKTWRINLTTLSMADTLILMSYVCF